MLEATTAATAQIVVLGSVNMDLVTTTDRLPSPGETLLGNSFSTIPGGKGGNQAIAAARAGGAVVFIGAVGRDDFGTQLTHALESSGVSVALLRHTRGPSGIAAITVDQRAENSIVVIQGANAALVGLTDADRDAVRTAGMLVCQLEIPISAVISAAGVAAAAGVPVLLNPSPARELPPELLASVSLLVLNETEAASIGPDAVAVVPHVVITLGAAGARYRGPDGQFDVRAPTVEAVDTTGAGDAFTGALAVAWTSGLSPRASVELACAAGALATTTKGAATSSPIRSAIDALAGATYRP
ncbi:ribokinase [Nakamurella sp. PAMC28650]|jgi:ribokinase|uniref:ribokinase n=1 Tax=Nakamurella sp. PAMC28650 TaxID=2762325 RepID=UPI00164D67CA|nr:ribokinase [Nakamurella sp. PAMC28650]QNK81020.1 ribokinase [Nakamurella sp. PAMC28650]